MAQKIEGRFMKSRYLTLFVCSFLLNSWNMKALADVNKDIDLGKGESRVEFLAIGKPSAIKIRGKGGPLQGHVGVDGNSVSGQIDFDLNSLDTGIGLRNTHMKEKYLQTAQFPKAQLLIKKVSLPVGWLTQLGKKLENLAFDGMLKLHGVEKPIVGVLSLTNSGQAVDGLAQFKVKISDYGIDVPKYAGISVTDEVEVETYFKSPMETKN
jgi:polyisoprenoid-binding protein YceI